LLRNGLHGSARNRFAGNRPRTTIPRNKIFCRCIISPQMTREQMKSLSPLRQEIR
jgi:hypothetical protein